MPPKLKSNGRKEFLKAAKQNVVPLRPAQPGQQTVTRVQALHMIVGAALKASLPFDAHQQVQSLARQLLGDLQALDVKYADAAKAAQAPV